MRPIWEYCHMDFLCPAPDVAMGPAYSQLTWLQSRAKIREPEGLFLAGKDKLVAKIIIKRKSLHEVTQLRA